jgi:hypothetical protein
MSTPIKLNAGDLGTGYCPPSYQDLYERMFALGSAEVNTGNVLSIIMQQTEPSATDRDKLWVKLNSDGSLDGLFVWFNGAWTRALPNRAIIQETYGSGVTPAAPTAATWNTRALNTSTVNTISGLSLASNQVTLPAGTYLIRASAPGVMCAAHQCRLADIDAGLQYYGTSEYAPGTYQIAANRTFVVQRVTIAAAHKFELQHYPAGLATAPATTFGVANTFGGTNVFAQMEIEKEQ